MRLPSLSSYAASPKRSLLLLACAIPTLFFLLSTLRSSSSSSSTSSTRGFASPKKASFDYSPYVFDANSDKHKQFCVLLKGLKVFKEALKEEEEEEVEGEVEGGEKSSPLPLAPSLSPSILLESLALRIASPNSPPLTSNHHTHPSLPFAYPPHHSVPHLIHQSWKSHDPPPLYEPMIRSWREVYPESRWVLWNDTDNRNLVQAGYPELLDVYDALGGEIYRADFIRNLYMHAFGGIYSDLDSQAYTSLHPLFTHLSPPSSTPDPIAFLGRMETFTYDSHSLPNAFFASSPGHPFWLEGPVARAVAAHKEGKLKTTDPEHLTGPVALKESEEWWNVWGGSGKKGKVVVLEPDVAYPYSWDWRSEMQECLCWARSIEFNAKMCRALLPEAYVISFWKHSW